MSLGMLGKYERLDVIGHGASSIVYLARDTLLRRQVAIKEIAAQGDEKSRFLEEARVLDRLRHPNIVRVNSVDTIGAKVVIDMEYVDGNNLQDMLRDADGPLPAAEAVDIAIQVCDGLAFAHANHTVHRDIKPANILVTSEHVVKLVDFGLAEVLGTNSYAGGAGTYAYMAPEDFDSDARSDTQSDLWSVGVILYEMLTGRRPFSVARPKDPFAWKRAIDEDEIAPPSSLDTDLPTELDGIVSRALSRDKAMRYPSADEIGRDLRRVRDTVVLPNAASLRFIAVPVSSNGEGSSASGFTSLPSVGSIPPKLAVPYESVTTEPPTLLGASDIDQFLTAAADRWEDARIALVSGALVRWLNDLDEAPLARVASSILADSSDEDQKLREFLYRSGVDTTAVARREAGIGNRLLRAGAFSDASEVLQKAVHLDPNRASYFLLLAKALNAQNDTAAATVVLEEGINRHPRHMALRRELKARGGARASLSDDVLDFGVLRHGQTRVQRIHVRNLGDGLLQGRVASLPGWIQVTPMTFATRHRQPLTIVADANHLLDGAGQYNDSVLLETTGGKPELRVSVRILPPRRTFQDIFGWYIPLLALLLTPMIVSIVTTIAHSTEAASHLLYLAGMMVSGLLAASLLAITVSADLGWTERVIPATAVVLAPIAVGLYISAARAGHGGAVMPILIETMIPTIILLVLQGAAMMRAPDTVGRWQVWSLILAATSIVMSIVLWHAPVWYGM